MTAQAAFRAKAPVYMDRLMADLDVDLDSAAAVFGNLGHESGGLAKLQEIKPTVKGSRGGYGWAQWTGPRRRAFEAWCKANKLSPSSDEANYRYLIVELTGPEKAAVAKLKAAKGIEAKVKAFELAYERAGVKHYDSRNSWARMALDAWNASRGKKQRPATPAPPADIYTSKAMVQVVQARLVELGYPLGTVDGVLGSLTKSSIRDFRADNGLSEGEAIDAAMVAALDTAKPRKLAPARADAPVEKVAEKAPETAANWRTEVLAKYGIAGSIILSILDWISKQFETGQEKLQPVIDLFLRVPGWAWFMLLAAVLLALWWHSRKGRIAGVEAFRAGARL